MILKIELKKEQYQIKKLIVNSNRKQRKKIWKKVKIVEANIKEKK
jgi:hypothetical protein